jgi:hypothetical protein
MCTKSTDDRGGGDDLEAALLDVLGVAKVLMEMAGTGTGGEALSYLGERLKEHYDDAYDAFARIYGLEPYNDKPAEGGVSREGRLDDAELRAKAEALAAEYDTPLPEGDAGLIEAYRRLREVRKGRSALYREFKIDLATERDITNAIIDPVWHRLWDCIEQTEPAGLAGAAAKLRLLMDEDIGIDDASKGEMTSLKQIADLIERLAEAQP